MPAATGQPPFKLSKRGLLAQSIAAATVTSTASVPVFAEEDTIEEVIVTVQRRAESVEEVPLAVSAFTGEFVRDVNLDDVKDLVAYTPGLTGNSKDSFIDVLQIRGIYTVDFGVGGDPSISFFKNGLYQGRNGTVVTSLYDIDRVEVVRGSQGFLFGRNAIAGAVSTHTRRPDFDTTNGYFEADIGERGLQVYEGALNVTLGDRTAARIALYTSQEDGYVSDVFDTSRPDLIAHDKQAARFSLRTETDTVEVNFMAEHEDRDQSGTVYRAIERGDSWAALQDIFGVSLRGSDRALDSDLGLGEGDDSKVSSFGLHVDVDLGWGTLTSQTGYRDHKYFYSEDFDGSPLSINNYQQDQEGDYLEQEFRIVSNDDEGPLSWYAGVSFYEENIDTLFTQSSSEEVMCAYYLSYYGFANCSEYFAYYGSTFVANPAGLVESNRVRGEYSGYAAYLDLTYKFSDKLDAGFGLRYTKDEKDFSNHAFDIESMLGPFWAIGFTTDGPLEDKSSWDDVTPRAVVRYFPNDDWMVFGNITTGYKSGGYGSFALTPDPAFGSLGVTQADARPDTYDGETSISYELGTKGQFADGRAQLDAVAYFYNYEDLQAVVPGFGGGIRVDNVGEVDGWGLETTLRVILSDNWDVFLSAAWADSEASDIAAFCGGTDECEGDPLPRLPEFSWGAILEGTFPGGTGEWFGRLEAFGQTETYGGFGNNPNFENEGYSDVALRGGYRSNDGWEVIGYAENLTDEDYFDAVIEDGNILPGTAFGPSRPRTVGVRFGWYFD